MKRIIIDLDNTLTVGESSDYLNASPRLDVIAKVREYKDNGFEIAIHTSRNMRTHQNSVGKITALTVPVIAEWLSKHDVPYDEIWVGKPWCGNDGFYVDDRAIRPNEFVELSYEKILDITGNVKSR